MLSTWSVTGGGSAPTPNNYGPPQNQGQNAGFPRQQAGYPSQPNPGYSSGGPGTTVVVQQPANPTVVVSDIR